EIAEEQTILLPEMNGGHGLGDLPRHEGFAAPRPLVIEQNAVGRVESVGLAVVHGDPIGIELGRSVRATRIKRRALGLRNFLHFAVKLGGRRLIETHAFTEAENTHALQQPQRTQRVALAVYSGVSKLTWT